MSSVSEGLERNPACTCTRGQPLPCSRRPREGCHQGRRGCCQPPQKRILKEFITSVNSNRRLYNLVNTELDNIIKEVTNLASSVKDDIVKIKLDEVIKGIKPLKKTDKVNDTHLVNLMQYYDLVNELKNL